MTSKHQPVSAMDTAKAHWPQMPEWVRMLADHCDRHTQAAAARRISRSASLVNQVLKNRYPGDLAAVKERVEAAFNVESVSCPILGPISGSDCLKHQAAPYNPANHMAVALFRQCRRCPNACGRKSDEPAR